MVRGLLRAPIDDAVAVASSLAADPRTARLLALPAAATASWWIYVPIHELLHVLGCMAGGGAVTRLELDPIYGAAWLQRIFPFVAVGSDYAGQLTGFDTRGSDLTYLLTDFLPFVLTVLVGVPLLRAAARARPGVGQAALLGAALPLALVPLASLTGDYFEMGSILVSRLVATSLAPPGFEVTRWRSDELFTKAAELWAADGGLADALGITVSLVIGGILAWLTYAAGVLCGDVLSRYGVTRVTGGSAR